MRTLCRLYPEKSDKVRLTLASLLVRKLDRPAEALRQLHQIVEGRLDAPLRAYRRKLLSDAERMIEDGVLELEEET